jgi:serine/threonine protein kinase
MEYMPLGDLTPFVEKGIPEQEVKAITLQLLEGLSLMHKHSLAHRDLKPAVRAVDVSWPTKIGLLSPVQNVFVKSASPQWFVKIGDFGIAKRCRGDSTALQTEVGTQGYLAPEIAVESNEQYTNACDIWSLGCVGCKALTQILPFPRYRDLNSFCSGKPFPVSPLSSKNISFSGVSFLEKLLAVDPIARLTAELALECDWLMVSECPPQSAADLEYQEEKSSANTLILRVVPEYAQESAAAGLGKQEEERVHGIGAVPEYSPQSSTDLENQEEWYRFQNLCDRGVNIVRLGVSGRYNDEYFFLDSTDSDNSRHL